MQFTIVIVVPLWPVLMCPDRKGYLMKYFDMCHKIRIGILLFNHIFGMSVDNLDMVNKFVYNDSHPGV